MAREGLGTEGGGTDSVGAKNWEGGEGGGDEIGYVYVREKEGGGGNHTMGEGVWEGG